MTTLARIEPGDGDPRHGTPNGYNNLHCHCQTCRDAWAELRRCQKAQREAALRAGTGQPNHGQSTTYGNWGCRCRECRDAWAADSRGRRARRRAS